MTTTLLERLDPSDPIAEGDELRITFLADPGPFAFDLFVPSPREFADEIESRFLGDFQILTPKGSSPREPVRQGLGSLSLSPDALILIPSVAITEPLGANGEIRTTLEVSVRNAHDILRSNDDFHSKAFFKTLGNKATSGQVLAWVSVGIIGAAVALFGTEAVVEEIRRVKIGFTAAEQAAKLKIFGATDAVVIVAVAAVVIFILAKPSAIGALKKGVRA